MKNKKLLIDTIPFIIESVQDLNLSVVQLQLFSNVVKLRGIIQRANSVNNNGRIYPKNVLLRLINRLSDAMRERRLTGLLDHPESFTVSLLRSCLLLTNTWWVGDTLWGLILLLSNGPGLSVKALVLKDKVTVGISSRGAGSTVTDLRGLIVQEDFQLITFDIVSLPSTIGAYMRPVMESKNIINKKTTTSLSNTLDKIICNI